MEKITLKFMAFRVAITLSLPLSLFLSPSPLQPFAACIVTRWFGPFYFTRFMCSLWERTAKQVCALWGTCNMPHAPCPMPHAPCVAMIFVANERVSAARFLARSGRAKWSWKVRTIDDRLMDTRTERGRDRQTEHTHTHTRTHTKTLTATEMDWQLRWRRPVTALT